MRVLTGLTLLLALAPALGACSPNPDWMRESTAALAKREAGLNARDLTLYLSSVSENYKDSATETTRIRERAKSLFEGMEKIQYHSLDRSLYLEGNRVRVVQRFTMEVTTQGQPKSLSGQEELFLRRESGAYRIFSGL